MDVIFDEEPALQPMRPAVIQKKSRSLTAWLLSARIVQNERQANVLLIVVAVAAFIGSAIFLYINHRYSAPTHTSHALDPILHAMPHA